MLLAPFCPHTSSLITAASFSNGKTPGFTYATTKIYASIKFSVFFKSWKKKTESAHYSSNLDQPCQFK